jgi:diaminohydroxyphosphoribosylaminopyrimidine deaminase/5-amino-6-(5-phosphoribosylamino)uracil reductase
MKPPVQFESPEAVMRYAIALARGGIGSVEPNPMVGAVLVDRTLHHLASGFHERFGGPHAEVNALRNFESRYPDAAGRAALLDAATLYVTLEPCCHFGKTPPCSLAVIHAGVKRVVVGLRDPSPHCDGGGIRQLQEAGVEVLSGLLEAEVRLLNAPFLKRVQQRRPWVHAKWAMTLDGRIATRTGQSQWISNESSRAIVHQLRGRMDAIVVGAGTARVDDPLLTARPPGPRTALRVVVDSHASLSTSSQLVRTIGIAPLMVVCSEKADESSREQLRQAGAEVLVLPGETGSPRPDLSALLDELGRRSFTNILIEGGAGLLGSCFDQNLVDEVHVFVAPKLCGGAAALSPVGGLGQDFIPRFAQVDPLHIDPLDGDVYIHGPLRSAPV